MSVSRNTQAKISANVTGATGARVSDAVPTAKVRDVSSIARRQKKNDPIARNDMIEDLHAGATVSPMPVRLAPRTIARIDIIIVRRRSKSRFRRLR